MVLFLTTTTAAQRSVTAEARHFFGRTLSSITTRSSQQVIVASGRSNGRGAMSRWFSSSKSNINDEYYTIGITGSTGLVGNAFRDELTRSAVSVNGKPVRVVRLIRSESTGAMDATSSKDDLTAPWNPQGETAEDILDPTTANQLDAIVHLSGENVATGLGPLGFLGIRPWTQAKKQEILDSRTVTTRALAKVVAAAPEPLTFLVASGVGVYGKDFFQENDGDNTPIPDESTDVSNADGFLAQVSRQWEAASELPPTQQQHRIVNMRFGVVLSKKGGALEKLYPIFLLGGGGLVGSGRQYFPFISARDHARAMVHTLQQPTLRGPVNLCAPHAATNAEFTKAFGAVLRRPTILPLPGFAVQLLFGEMGEEMLLGGVRAQPQKLLESGFEFQHPTVELALQSAMDETI